jgi:hypothetical protein
LTSPIIPAVPSSSDRPINMTTATVSAGLDRRGPGRAWSAVAFAVSFELLLQQRVVVPSSPAFTRWCQVPSNPTPSSRPAEVDRAPVDGRPSDVDGLLVARVRELVTAARATGRPAAGDAGSWASPSTGRVCCWTWPAPADTRLHNVAPGQRGYPDPDHSSPKVTQPPPGWPTGRGRLAARLTATSGRW